MPREDDAVRVEFVGGPCCGERAWLAYACDCGCGELLNVGDVTPVIHGFVRHFYRVERLEGDQAWAKHFAQEELTFAEVLGCAE